MENKYNILVDFGVQGYNVHGGIFTILKELWKNRKSNAKIEITKLTPRS